MAKYRIREQKRLGNIFYVIDVAYIGTKGIIAWMPLNMQLYSTLEAAEVAVKEFQEYDEESKFNASEDRVVKVYG